MVMCRHRLPAAPLVLFLSSLGQRRGICCYEQVLDQTVTTLANNVSGGETRSSKEGKCAAMNGYYRLFG